MRVCLVLCLTMLSALAAGAQGGEKALSKLSTAYEARGWEAVGRLNIGRNGMCTGALIEADLVLTAGHCLYSQRTGNTVDPRSITFLAGWREGRAAATRKVRRAVIHPEYVYSGSRTNETVQHDLAILELESPIRLSTIQPFPVGKRPRKGADVGVVSYAKNRADTASIQKLCHVLARPSGTLILSCDVDFGASGAPVFADIDNAPRIVSVVSAMSEIRGRPVAFGTRLAKPLKLMREMLREGAVLNDGAPATVSAKRSKPVKAGKPRVLRGGSGGTFHKP
ncbi:MAG: trypsin-like serine protease [Silicimonas sp.]|nr:trypsin-like serine protease [Silicimonas sp.]